MHFDGKAALWFQNFSLKQADLTWDQFVEIISTRFKELKEASTVTAFNKLKQTGSLREYVGKFEELKACLMLLKWEELSESYFVASFISGLTDEL